LRKLRPQEIDYLLRLMAMADTPQNLDAFQYTIFQFDAKDYNSFIVECPPGSIRFTNVLRVAAFCDNLGALVEAGALPEEAVFEVFPVPWAKLEPIVKGLRQDFHWPDLFDMFERLGQRYQKWLEAKYKKLKITEAKPEQAPAPARPLPTGRPVAARPAVAPRPQAPRPPVKTTPAASAAPKEVKKPAAQPEKAKKESPKAPTPPKAPVGAAAGKRE